jgi:hypothetical protein
LRAKSAGGRVQLYGEMIDERFSMLVKIRAKKELFSPFAYITPSVLDFPIPRLFLGLGWTTGKDHQILTFGFVQTDEAFAHVLQGAVTGARLLELEEPLDFTFFSPRDPV